MDFESQLAAELSTLADQGLYRQLRRIDSSQSSRVQLEKKSLLNFSSNDYLGLANHPLIKEAAQKAVRDYGAGSGASRLICGSLAPHHELEEQLATFKGTPAALSFSSGYAAALGTIGSFIEKDDLIILDHLVHACLVDATRLSGAKIRVFSHNSVEDLERILLWATARRRGTQPSPSTPFRRILIITESVFSMDGDLAPLAGIIELKEKYGAWLMVDEAHATGLYGPRRRGVAEALGVSQRIEIQMGTLGKALGSAGGYICGSQKLVDLLVNRARSFIFSTAPVPAAAAAAAAAVRFVQEPSGMQQCDLLWKGVELLRLGFKRFLGQVQNAQNGAGVPSEALRGILSAFFRQRSPLDLPSAIIPLVIGNEDRALQWADALRREGIYVPAIRYPTVARGKARLRVTLTAAHSAADVEQLLSALARVKS